MAEAQHAAQPPPIEPGPLTLDGYFALADRQPVEIVNGEVVVMTPHQRPHARIAQRLFRSLDRFVGEHELGEVWLETPFVLDADERTRWVKGVRVPDLAFTSLARTQEHDQKFGADGPWRIAPDLAVEIVSPTDTYSDVNQKVADYLRFGVRLVWVIDPQARTVRVFSPDAPDGHILADAERLNGEPVVSGWEMEIRTLLDG